ncbi:hypothetical protein DQ04_03181050 [Trypanosoma grayi]|uniref:hypothetical protein n=1 Tax=Trypanosoma grayi TaxID=71804 RepID=UPI0004F474EC|nr:hypothetical protein DQ04_03181050 [Trypanosoma grayi]KEG10892.1 hypothetical protein DQ04_03181050 [Trypanosoma grayi]
MPKGQRVDAYETRQGSYCSLPVMVFALLVVFTDTRAGAHDATTPIAAIDPAHAAEIGEKNLAKLVSVFLLLRYEENLSAKVHSRLIEELAISFASVELFMQDVCATGNDYKPAAPTEGVSSSDGDSARASDPIAMELSCVCRTMERRLQRWSVGILEMLER